jgi:hypothetical protein
MSGYIGKKINSKEHRHLWNYYLPFDGLNKKDTKGLQTELSIEMDSG